MTEDNQTTGTEAVETDPTDAEASSGPAKKKTKRTAKKAKKKAAKKKAKKKARKKAAPAADASEDTSEEGGAATPDGGNEAVADSEGAADAPAAEAAVDEEAGSPEPPDAEPQEAEPQEAEPREAKPRAAEPKKKRRSSKKKSSRTGKSESGGKTATSAAGSVDMIVNYVPGEECRVAMVEKGQLEEFYSEPTGSISRVGNIYVGRVTNVESAIQAAFVDFGIEENGFLHVSDLHPMYFPGEDEETTERVGKKTPRRSRPPIQQALKRGQEIVVQVLKEGVGTKGPTLTSYLSVPGRFLVMMPNMDKVGVSRKEDDEDRRKKARAILDQLDLPDGFGFILRTAGFDRTKTELKRDLAYLQRLWSDMEKRRTRGNRPRLLYSESDLLVRSLRDLMTGEVGRVIIDSDSALRRASRFMKIVAPRSQAKLMRYDGAGPVFHAFGVEEQIRQIHAREVPLPSGGRLVIDQAEACVAIDVNSGKSRAARDAETNAFKTNVEAVDVICRQLRLRDLGGLVINDLIDMRHARHRKEIEERFKERLRRDRARSTILPISDFGILEMTRQRMRGSQESIHFADCPTCRGRGLVQRPDSVAADALREVASILDYERVHKVELVVHPRVAGALLSTRRTSLTRVELRSGKTLDVRVSETLAADRVTVYAYDDTGSDIEIEKLPKRRGEPAVVNWEEDAAADGWAADIRSEVDEAADRLAEELARASHAEDVEQDVVSLEADDEEQPKKKRRRRRRRRRKSDEDGQDGPARESTDDGPEDRAPAAAEASDETAGDDADADEPAEGSKKKRRRRRRRRKSGDDAPDGPAPEGEAPPAAEAETVNGAADDADDGAKKKRRRRSRKKKDAGAADEQANGAVASVADELPVVETPAPKRRGLYSRGRRRLSPSEIRTSQDD